MLYLRSHILRLPMFSDVILLPQPFLLKRFKLRTLLFFFVLLAGWSTTSISDSAYGQRLAPVGGLNLSPLSISQNDNNESLAVNFVFQKFGGIEQIQRQACLLLYLKRDQAEILKLARAAETPLTDEDDQTFEKLIKNGELVQTLISSTSIRTDLPDSRVSFPFNLNIKWSEIELSLIHI